ncbi:MAG: hypothetical protein WC700_07665 [Gemmatimonadaceae bacterium]|jgi:dUTPase
MDEFSLLQDVEELLGVSSATGPIFLIRAVSEASLYSNIEEPGGVQGNSGVDLRFPDDVKFGPSRDNDGRPTMVDLGVRVRCIRRSRFVPYEIRARSSIAKTPLLLANSVGTIDRGYTGNLRVAVHNLSSYTAVANRGDSLFQLTLPTLKPARVYVITNQLPPGMVEALFGDAATARGAGGFGSTGTAGTTK